ncbi:MAG: hypothetical protein RR400_01620, partial [Clostridia bacterium]
MDFVTALLNVLAIIGIILTGGFLIFFLGDLLLSVLDPNYSNIFQKRKGKNKDNGKTSKIGKEETFLLEDVKKEETNALVETKKEEDSQSFYDYNEKEDDKVSFNDFDDLDSYDEEAARREEKMLASGATSNSDNDSFANLQAEEEAFKQERLKIIEERKNKILEADAKDDNKNTFFEEDDLLDFNFDEEDDEEVQNFIKEEESSENDKEAEVEEIEEDTETIDADNETMNVEEEIEEEDDEVAVPETKVVAVANKKEEVEEKNDNLSQELFAEIA